MIGLNKRLPLQQKALKISDDTLEDIAYLLSTLPMRSPNETLKALDRVAEMLDDYSHCRLIGTPYDYEADEQVTATKLTTLIENITDSLPSHLRQSNIKSAISYAWRLWRATLDIQRNGMNK